MRARRWQGVLLGAAVLITGCGGGGGGAAAVVPAHRCAPPARERLDPQSTIHLFPGAPPPHYLTDPPTSGPHQLGPPFKGVLTAPIPRPRQVAMLETGYVIVQQDGLSPAELTTLDTVAGTLVSVAPSSGRLPSRVVATAWTWKLECNSVDLPALATIRAFVAAHQGAGFAGKIPANGQ